MRPWLSLVMLDVLSPFRGRCKPPLKSGWFMTTTVEAARSNGCCFLLQHNRSSNYSQASLSMNLTGLEPVEEFSTEMEISSSLFALLVAEACLLSLDDEKTQSLSCHLARLLQNCTMSVHFSEVTNYVLISWDECPFVFSVRWKCVRRRSCL